MKILLTGAFGYLGGRLSLHLHDHGFDLILGSRHPRPSPPWLPDARTAVTDWSDRNSLEAICAGIDLVVHLAGMNAGDSGKDPVGALALNGVATARLVEAAIASGVPRLIYLSTAHVYANPLIGTISERDCPTNLHPYATSHRAGEDSVRAAHAAGRIEGMVVRLSNAFGAPADPSSNCWMLLVNDLARQAVREGKMSLKSSGSQRRNFVPLGEVCRVLSELAVLPAERIGDGVFNLGSAESITVLQMAEQVAERFKSVTGRHVDLAAPGAAPADAAGHLDYRSDRLAEVGIEKARGDAAAAELDALIRFCLAEARK